MTATSCTMAIVGLGPRGHYALECLMAALIDARKTDGVKILGFEPTPHAGYGPVYDRQQPGSNWINITDRLLDLPGRAPMQFGPVRIDAFPGYFEWAGLDFDTWPPERVDTFPPRATLGNYLGERFDTLCEPLRHAGVFTLVGDTVDRIAMEAGTWRARTRSGDVYPVDDVLLTVGHQPTVADAQLSGWREYVDEHTGLQLFEDAYPVERIVEAVRDRDDGTVAIRGYGLATIDVARALAETFGSFSTPDAQTRACTYSLAPGRRLHMAPFSLDGLCISPKPVTPAFDSLFAPTGEELAALFDHIGDRQVQAGAKDANVLVNAMCPIIVRVFGDLPEVRHGAPGDPGEIEHLIRKWIQDARIEHACIEDTSLPPADMLAALAGMALGERPVTLDYCIGQVWRQCQATIYTALSHGALPDTVLADIIGVDETLKRYTYGPPVESLQQLIALHEAGVLDLDVLTDPDINVCEEGWILQHGGTSVTASVMINAVVDAPDIKAVCSPLVSSLLDDGLVSSVHDGLGVATGTDGYVTAADESVRVPIALLGRLCKGTVIGVDAILECFGHRVREWAASAVKHL